MDLGLLETLRSETVKYPAANAPEGNIAVPHILISLACMQLAEWGLTASEVCGLFLVGQWPKDLRERLEAAETEQQRLAVQAQRFDVFIAKHRRARRAAAA